MSKVVMIRCNSYETKAVNEAIQRGVQLLGGIDKFITPGETILLKPNLVAADPPEKCSTTHPAVMAGLLNLLSKQSITVTYGDSPGFHSPEVAAKKSGLAEVADQYNIQLADFVNGEDVFNETSVQNKLLHIAKGVLEADGVISLPKLKTHGFQKMTGAIKNQFGCVPGPLKGEMHVKLPNAEDFSKMLVDLNDYIKPRLYIMDGIMAMEGNGPRGGHPLQMNVLLLSADPVALDAVVCRMVDLDPALVPTTKMGQEIGLGTYLEENIELLGDDFKQFIQPKFDVNRQALKPFKAGFIAKITNKLIVPKPFIKEDQCVKCGVCVLMCPVEGKAINWDKGDKKKPPIYNYNKCIRCYCCQEMCPESAIELDVPILRRLINKSTDKMPYKH